MLGHNVSAQEYIISSNENTIEGVPISYIDSITHINAGKFSIYLSDTVILADTLFFNHEISDTLLIVFGSEHVKVNNPNVRAFRIRADKTKVTINAHTKNPFVCRISGTCPNGQLVMDADTTCTLVLDNLQLASGQSAAICLPQKQKVILELPEGTHSILKDAEERTDTSDVSIGCLYARGTIDFIGRGTLDVTGQYRHAIASGKNISIEGPHIAILDVMKNGIHCDKFTLKDGQIDLTLNQDVSKGIKTKKELNVKGGKIYGEAYGNVEIKDGDVSYCTLLKSDGTMDISDGSLSLRHYGKGGRCISVDSTMVIKGGTLELETYGDGDRYLTEQGDTAYYTPKCMTADDSVFIERGTITCLSTGLGGKGIVAGRYLSIGNEENIRPGEFAIRPRTDGDLKSPTLYSGIANPAEQGLPVIRIETKGECIKNDENEDERAGCPKGIKADEELHIYSGDISVTTAGMGGEGVECNGAMYIHGGTLECNTYDDGINVGRSIEISGGAVYCNSVDNDGIDSNGSIIISGGIVAAVNQSKPNECLDAEMGHIHFTGGTFFGLGSGAVDVAESSIPCYSTPFIMSEDGETSRGFILNQGKYVCLQEGNSVIMAIRNDNRAFRTFVTIASQVLSDEKSYILSEDDCPIDVQQALFGNRWVSGGKTNNSSVITTIKTKTIKQ